MRSIIVVAALLMLSFVQPPYAVGKDSAPVAVLPQVNVADQLSRATLAVYGGEQECAWGKETIFIFQIDIWECRFKEHFICTATVVDQDSDTDSYTGLTAGHCFDWDKEDKYYVAETTTGKPVLHKIKLIKFENDERYDYAIFEFHSLEDYPVIHIKDIRSSATPPIGTEVVNVNFSLGVVKGVIQGKVVSDVITSDAEGRCEVCKGRFLASVGVGPGASGSAIVDETGQMVGIVEAVFPNTQMPTLVIPVNKNFADFMQDDSAGIKPLPEGPKPKDQDAPTSESGVTKALKFIFRLFTGL